MTADDADTAMDADKYMRVDLLIHEVKAAVRQAGVSREDAGARMHVESVQLILRVVAVRVAGVGVQFRIPVIGLAVRAGARVTRQETHIIDVTLKPSLAERTDVHGEALQEALVQAIRTVQATVASGAGGEDPWELDTGRIDLEFVVTSEGTVSLGVEGELTDDISHTLRLCLAPRTPVAVPRQAPNAEPIVPSGH